MRAERAVLLTAAIGCCALWLTLSGGGREARAPASVPDVRSTSSPLDPVIRDVQSQAGRLRAFLAAPARLTQPTRNPFRFRTAEQPPSPPTRPAPALSTRAASMAALERPPLVLAGVAEDVTPEGPRRTAIISGLGQLFLVQEGETLARRYRVVRIGSTAVHLVDLTDQTPVVISLK